MPGPPQFGGAPITNIRNLKSPHWLRWLGPSSRCIVPATSFCEYADTSLPLILSSKGIWSDEDREVGPDPCRQLSYLRLKSIGLKDFENASRWLGQFIWVFCRDHYPCFFRGAWNLTTPRGLYSRTSEKLSNVVGVRGITVVIVCNHYNV